MLGEYEDGYQGEAHGADIGRADRESPIYSRQIVCSCSEDQNLSRDRQVLHRQSG